jgi:RuvB-like protein 2
MTISKTQEVKNLSTKERIGAYSHITGLWLNENLQSKMNSQGMVGQVKILSYYS